MDLTFNNIVTEQFEFVKALVSKNGKKLTVIRHKRTGEKFVRIDTPQNAEIYNILKKTYCPNLPRVYGVFKAENGFSVIEEYIDGLTVAQVMSEGLYSEAAARKVAKDICCALSALHSKGVIHRDIKPENIIIDKNGTAKLIDFDAARLYKSYKTQDTTFIGTTGFAAPEQYGVAQSDERSDIFSLGVLMNVMLTGEHPSRKMYSGRLAKNIEKCINIDPKKRYSSVINLYSKL